MASTSGSASKYKIKWTQSFLCCCLPPHVQKSLSRIYRVANRFLGIWLGVAILVLVVVDSTANNWAVNDFCGNGLQFRTPLARTLHALDLNQEYSFARGYNLSDLSNIGFWMTNYAVENLAKESSQVYVLAGGKYTVTDKSMDLCSPFSGNYSVDIAKPFKLAHANDAMTYLRGSSLTHWTSDDLTENLPSALAKSPDLAALGFVGARVQVDMRFTTAIQIPNASTAQTMMVQWYRVYAKSYCTGCTPIAELGRGTCNMTLVYNSTTGNLRVRSTFVVDSQHDLGIMFGRDVYSTISAILKYIAILIAVAGYVASCKTVQWEEIDGEKVETVWSKVLRTIAPKYFPHASNAIRFDIFCYNSDIFVVLFVASNLLDMNHSLVFTREVNWFNDKSPQWIISLQLFALSTRLLWLNVGLVKFVKLLLHLIMPASYCGDSVLTPWLTFSSVNSLYVSAVMLYFVPPYIEYNNKGRFDLHNNKEQLDGLVVDYFSSFYFRVAPAITFGLIGNVAIVLSIDHILFMSYWKEMKKNSLSRQAIYNSTAVISEFVSDVQTKNGQTILCCRARRLSTLQWYFASHMICFGLPEREVGKRRNSVTSMTKCDSTADTKEVICIVGQSDTGHLHLFDENLYDVKSLAFNIKILRNSYVLIR